METESKKKAGRPRLSNDELVKVSFKISRSELEALRENSPYTVSETMRYMIGAYTKRAIETRKAEERKARLRDRI